MKKILTFILSAASILAAQSCCEIEDGWTDIDSWPAPAKKYEPAELNPKSWTKESLKNVRQSKKKVCQA